MPILQYRCTKCGKKFEELVKNFQAQILCPDCGAECGRDYSGDIYSATGKPVKKCSGNCRNCSGCK